MNTVDIVILICLVPAVIQGLVKGFVTQAAGLLGVILGVWCSFHFSEMVSEWLAPHISASAQVLHIIAFTVILIAVILVLALLGRALKGILKFAMLGWVDKLLGVVFGLLKAGLILGILVMLFDSVNTQFSWVNEETLSGSVLYPIVKDITYTVFPYLKSLFTNGQDLTA